MRRPRYKRLAAAVATALLVTPMSAAADPVTILVTVAVALAEVAPAALALAAVAMNVIGGLDARRKARNAAAAGVASYNASLSDRTVSTLTADPPWRIRYGRCVAGGDIVAILTSDKASTRTDGSSYTRKDGYKHLVIVVAAHECEAINEVYIDGTAVGALDSNGWATTGDFASANVTNREISLAAGASTTLTSPMTVISALRDFDTYLGMAPTGTYSLSTDLQTVTNTDSVAITVSVTYSASTGIVRVSKNLGTAAQAADSYLLATVPTQWGSTDTLSGLCYIVLTLDLEATRFQGGPPAVTIDVSGRKVFDPRSGTTAYSTNPALCIRDWLRAPWGFEVASGEIGDAAFIVAANGCDGSTSFTEGSSTFSGPLYTCNGTFTTKDPREAVLSDLADSMGGHCVYGASWEAHAGIWTASVMDLSDDDLHGQIELVQAGAALDDSFNGVRGTFVPQGSAVASEFDSYVNSTYLAADGRALWTDVALPYTDGRARARNLARVMTEANRSSQIIRYPAKLKAWPLRFGDRVRVSSAEYGFTLKTYRVTDWQFGVGSAVMLTLQADSAGIYDLADAATAEATPNTLLPNPWLVASLSGLGAVSAGNYRVLADGTVVLRALVSWTAVTDGYALAGGRIEVGYRSSTRDAANVWRSVGATGSDTQAWLDDLSAADVLTIRARAVNSLGQVGAWSFISHTVAGKSAAASNVAGLSGSVSKGRIVWVWTAATDADYNFTELRLGGSDWASAATPAAFKGTANTWAQVVSAAGTYTARVRHLDSSGNYSAGTASASVTVASGDLVQDGAAGADAVTLTLSSYAVALQAASDGTVPSFAAATATGKVQRGATDDTSNWTFSKADGSGVTSSMSGAVLMVSALSVDSGYVDVTATRSGYPTQTARFVLTKVRSSAVLSGLVAGFGADVWGYSTAGTATASVRVNSNGTVESNDGSGWVAAGNWYLPTTTGIGSSYWLRAVPTSGAPTAGDTTASWLALSSARTFTITKSSGIGSALVDLSLVLSSASGGSPVVATGVASLLVERGT